MLQILTAGLQAPSAVNRQPWAITYIEDQDLVKRIEETAIDYFRVAEDQSSYERITERGNGIFYGAKTLVLISIDNTMRDAALLDAGIVTQNIVLAAESLGYNTLICGMTRAAFLHETKGEALLGEVGFKEDYVFAVSVLIGHAKDTREPHTIDLSKLSRI